jgi:predicted nucleic acid-binding protein
MILVDTSIWVDHFQNGDPGLAVLLQTGQVLAHPFVIGELALDHLGQRDLILGDLAQLPRVVTASDVEVLGFIRTRKLFGLGYVDAHLLAAVQLTAAATLWTRDKRLMATAKTIALPVR